MMKTSGKVAACLIVYRSPFISAEYYAALVSSTSFKASLALCKLAMDVSVQDTRGSDFGVLFLCEVYARF